ncbi:putative ribonucleoside triphosphate reductase alphachain [Vibrio phage 496E54-1]|nr:putative ribonucleoside triphosphate reductase alphachain [Vibrio phage 495E54-1]CAH9014429.1 putative ribonucleoside triphosphate reductase alphachain [Vibrio phage 496E54-1]
MTIKTVIKSDGTEQVFDASKLNRWGEWATKQDLSWSDIVMKTLDQLFDKCTTKDIHQAMINVCVDKKDDKHLAFAARLLRGSIYKDVYNGLPTSFTESYNKLVKEGFWQDFKLTVKDLEKIEDVFDPSWDKTYEYTSLLQFVDKYAMRVFTDKSYRLVETPQLALMGIALALFQNDSLEHALNFYRIIRERKLNIATPIMASARSGENEFTSCFLATAGDTLDSIAASNHLCYTMTANRAGVGMEYDVRSFGDVVGNNKCKHSGKLPHYNMLLSTIKSVTQGVRGGAATVTFNVLDPEFDDLIRLKNPTTAVAKRIELMDYSLAWNDEFLRRVAKNEDWLLISKKECPELHEYFYSSPEKFSELLANKIHEYSGTGTASDFLNPDFKPKEVKKFNGRVVKARDIFKTFLQQRQETGRMYCINIDTVNSHTAFEKDVIRQANLCIEVCLPTKGFDNILSLYKSADPDKDGMVGLCFLLATDVGKCSYDELDEVNYYACRALDNILSLTKYPYKALEDIGKKYRSIGVGVTNLAYYLAKNGVTYSSEEGRNLVHKLMEKQQYSLVRSSIELAKERGKFEWYDRTKYGKGSLCIDTYTKEIDKYHSQELLLDWEELKAKQLRHGMRFVTVSAHMPCESSSAWGFSTNGLYPIRQGVVLKSRPEGLVPFRAPEYERLKDMYELAWDVDTQDMYKIYGIVQKFTCMSISADSYLDFSKLPDGRVPMKKMMQDMLFSQKVGMKAHYYLNSRTEGKHVQDSEDSSCESCKL